MPEDVQLYGPEYEEELFKKLAPAIRERIQAQYKNRGVRFGREGGDVADAENKLRQEIGLQVAQKNAEVKGQLLLRQKAEEERIREEQRAEARDTQKRGYEQTREDRKMLEYRDMMDKQHKQSQQDKARDQYYRFIEEGYSPTEMGKFRAGALPGQQGKGESPDWQGALNELTSGIDNNPTASGIKNYNVDEKGNLLPEESSPKSGFRPYQGVANAVDTEATAPGQEFPSYQANSDLMNPAMKRRGFPSEDPLRRGSL